MVFEIAEAPSRAEKKAAKRIQYLSCNGFSVAIANSTVKLEREEPEDHL